jgi:ankyrin repeat protein
MEMLQQIGDALPRFQVYEQLFRNHQSLQQALSLVYLELISFVTRAKKVFSGSSFRLFGRVLWRSFDQTFHDSLSEVRRHSDLVEREATLAHMLEESQARMELTELRSLIEAKQPSDQGRLAPQHLGMTHTLTAAGFAGIKRWLDARQCQEEKVGIEILPGTCEWILGRPELSSWISKDEIRLFWIYGAPGCGKSFLYAKILDHIDTTTKLPCAYFLFCGADGERVTVSSLLRSWAFQLTKIFDEAKKYVCSVQLASENREATAKEVDNLFLSLLAFLPACFLTVDAVDECLDRSEFYRLLPLIPRRFKVLITSRHLAELSNHLNRVPDQQHVSLEVLPEMTRSDIDRYITSELKNPECHYEPGVSSYIKERLTRSNGMFLWVRLMLQHIQDQTNNEEIMQCLGERELPTGLSERYDRILKNINDLAKPRRLLAHKVFFWITVARRPLHVKEVSGLLAVKPSSDRANAFEQSRRMISDPESTILSVCGSLITARGPGRALYPIHFTVTEYLKQYLESSERLDEITGYYDARQLQSNDSLAAAVCIRYLSLDFIAGIHEELPSKYSEAVAIFSSNTPNLDILQYATTHWFHHLQRVESPELFLLAVAEEFLDDARPNLEVFWHLYWFSAPESKESAICPGKFSGNHIAAYFGLHHVLRHLLPSGDPTVLDSLGRSALWWAATRSHGPATKVLIEAGVVPNVPDKFSITPAHRAAAIGNAGVFEQIISAQSEDSQAVVDAEGWTPLHWASSRGHYAVVERILDHREGCKAYGTPYSRTRSGRTPLHLAALNGKTALISELGTRIAQKHSNRLNIQDSKGQTALHLAAASGHLRSVEELVRCGADTTIRDHSGKTPADKASEMGNSAVHAALVELSNNAQVTDNGEQHVKVAVDRLTKYGLQAFRNRFIDAVNESNSRYYLNSLDAQDSSTFYAMINGHHLSLTILIRKQRKLDTRDERGRTLLHHAVAVGEVECAKELVKELKERKSLSPEFLDLQDDRGWTALHYAAVERFHLLVKIILEAGASVSIPNTAGLTAYDIALKGAHREVVEALARYGRIPTDQIAKDFGWNVVHCSAREGNFIASDATRALLEERDVFGRAPIYRALEMGNWEVAKTLGDHVKLLLPDIIDLATAISEEKENHGTLHYLLAKLPPFSIPTAKGDIRARAQQLLVVASRHNDVPSITALVASGVDIDSRDQFDLSHRRTALQVAINAGSVEAAIHLIKCGADVRAMDTWGDSALHVACAQCLPEVVECLLNHGADPNQQNVPRISNAWGAKWTPLHTIFEHHSSSRSLEKSLTIASLLLDHGAALLGVENDKGESPGWRAVHNYPRRPPDAKRGAQYGPILNLIASKGFGMIVQPIAEDGFSPIHLATKMGDLEYVKRELDRGVPVDWKTFDYPHRRPLQIAVAEDNIEMAKLLLERGADLRDFGDLAGVTKRKTWEVAIEVKSKEMRKLLQAELLKRSLGLK